jgi:hypothetical protein
MSSLNIREMWSLWRKPVAVARRSENQPEHDLKCKEKINGSRPKEI